MWEIVKKAVIELFWPIVKDILKKYSKELIEWLVAKLKSWVNNRNSAHAHSAENKAKEAEDAARAASSPSEAETHEAVAKVWREVAEMFRRENEALAEEVKNLRATAIAESDSITDNLTYGQAIEERDGKLQVNDQLPRLPD